LLYGPPGTGKTFVAKAVATEYNLPFLSVKGPELLGSYIGESEAHIRAIFAQARQLAQQNLDPTACILFFDELDSVAPRRGEYSDSGGNVMDRVVSSMFIELDTDPVDDVLVFCIGATNRPDMLDPSLLRPGRFDRLVYLGVSASDYALILTTHLRKLRLDEDVETVVEKLVPVLPTNLTAADLSTIATGALILATERLCNEADRQLLILQEQQRVNGDGDGSQDEEITIDDVLASWEEDQLEPVVTCDDLLEVATGIIPSVSAEELEKYALLSETYQIKYSDGSMKRA
jgi:peroxin-6